MKVTFGNILKWLGIVLLAWLPMVLYVIACAWALSVQAYEEGPYWRYYPTERVGAFQMAQWAGNLALIGGGVALVVLYVVRAVKARNDRPARASWLAGVGCLVVQVVFGVMMVIELAQGSEGFWLNYYNYETSMSGWHYWGMESAMWLVGFCAMIVAIVTAAVYLCTALAVKNAKTGKRFGGVMVILWLGILPILLAALTHLISTSQGTPYNTSCCEIEAPDPPRSTVDFFVTVETIGCVMCWTLAVMVAVVMWWRFWQHRKKRKPFFALELLVALLTTGEVIVLLGWVVVFLFNPTGEFSSDYIKAYMDELSGNQELLPTSCDFMIGGAGVHIAWEYVMWREINYILFIVLPASALISLIYGVVVERKELLVGK